MKISRSEQIAIQEVLAYGEAYGYGNLITHLQTAWAARLMRSGISEKAARAATARDGGGYPFKMQADLIERGEWDETGQRYSRPKLKGGASDPPAQEPDKPSETVESVTCEAYGLRIGERYLVEPSIDDRPLALSLPTQAESPAMRFFFRPPLQVYGQQVGFRIYRLADGELVPIALTHRVNGVTGIETALT